MAAEKVRFLIDMLGGEAVKSKQELTKWFHGLVKEGEA